MTYRITIEWDNECGIDYMNVLDFLDKIEDKFKDQFYGASVSHISVVMTCMGRDFKQRKRFNKAKARLEYDIILDYYLIKNVALIEKKQLIKYQMINITEHTLSKFNFDDFNKDDFLNNFKNIVNSINW